MKKGKVYRSRKMTWVMSLMVLISSYFIYDYYVSMLNGVEPVGINLVFVILMSFCIVMMEYVVLYGFIWVRVETYKLKNKAKRFAYHYDRIMKAFADKDYDKFKSTYNNRFENDPAHKHFADKIKFAYEVVTKK